MKKSIILITISFLFLFIIVISLRITNLNFKIQEEKKIQWKNKYLTGKIFEEKKNYFFIEINKHNFFLNKQQLKNSLIQDLTVEDKIKFFLKQLKEIPGPNNLFEFNFKNFLKTKWVFKQIIIDQNKKINIFKKNSFKRNFYFNIRKKQNNFNSWAKIFFLQIEDKNNEEIIQLFQKTGGVFLLVISGFHINIIFSFLRKNLYFVAKKIKNNKIKKKILDFISIGITFFFIYLINFPLPANRAFIYLFIIKNINIKKVIWKGFFLQITILLGFLFFNPFFIFRIGFQLTFLVSIIINLFYIILNKSKIKKNWKTDIFLFFFIYLVTLPYNLVFEQKINIFSITLLFLLNNVIKLIFIITFIFSIFQFLIRYFDFIFLLFNKLIVLMNKKINIFILLFKPSVWELTLYYLPLIFIITCFIYTLLKKGGIKFWTTPILLIPLFIYVFYNDNVNTNFKIHFLNVGNAQTIIISTPQKKTILIDCGIGNKFPKKTILNYLKANGFWKIEKLFITHFHYDHFNGIKTIKKEIKINEIINNKTERKFFIIEDNFVIENLNFNINPNWNENNKSLVLLIKIFQNNFLITGDIEKKREEIITNFFQKKSIITQILQIPHHGSAQTSSKTFLNSLGRPKYCVISTAKKINPLLRNRLKENCNNVMQTNYLKTIIFEIKHQKLLFLK